MNSEFDKEFEKRLEDSNWGRSLSNRVIQERSRRKRKFQLKATALLVVATIGITLFSFSPELEIELSMEDASSQEIYSFISGNDFILEY